jgi:CheY-like chemotaxis protein
MTVMNIVRSNIPKMGGLELLDRIRSDPKLVLYAVYVVTTSQYDEDALAAYKHYFTGYTVKESLNEGLNNY